MYYSLINSMNRVVAPSYPTSLKFFIDISNSLSYSGSGTNVYDLTTNDNDGVLINGVGYSTLNSGILTFNGTNQYIDLDTLVTETTNTATDSFTYLAWFKPNSLPAGGANLFARNSNSNGNQFIRTEGSVLRGGVQDTSANGNIVTGSTTLNTSTWYQGAFTYDGATKTTKLYLNTNLEGSATNASLSGNLFSVNNVFIGKRQSDMFFNGSIGVTKYYQEARTLAQITTDFNEFKDRYTLVNFIDPANYVSGTTIVDTVGNANGTLLNGVAWSSLNGGVFLTNGTNQYIDLGTSSIIQPNSARTVIVWASINSGVGMIYSTGNMNANRETVSIWQDSSNFYTVIGNTTTAQTITSAKASTGVWVEFKLRFNGTTIELYFNDVLQYSTTQTVIPTTSSTIPVRLGTYNGTGYYLNGKLGVQKIYSEYRTTTEMTTDFNLYKSRYGY